MQEAALAFKIVLHTLMSFPSWLSVRNLLANAGGAGSVPRLGRPPGEGNGTPLQYSCLENPTDRGLVGYSPGVTKVTDTTERLSNNGA